MRTTATKLVAFAQCPFLYKVLYEIREPLPVLGTQRAFGNVIHATIAAYEKERSLDQGFEALEKLGNRLNRRDLDEARSILAWRHDRAQERAGKPVLIEGSLRASLAGHRLEVRMDRLDAVGQDLLLAEYKGGKTVDLDLVRIQMMLLSYAIHDVFGRAPRRWELELLRERRIVNLDAETSPRNLAGYAAGLVNQVAQPSREPNPQDPRFCARCPARPFCPRHCKSPKEFSRNAVDRGPQLFLF